MKNFGQRRQFPTDHPLPQFNPSHECCIDRDRRTYRPRQLPKTRRGPSRRTACALLPIHRFAPRRRGPGAGDVSEGMARNQGLRGPLVASELALPDCNQCLSQCGRTEGERQAGVSRRRVRADHADACRKGGKTEVRFTHVGLVREHECFNLCSDAWGFYIRSSLRGLITKGVGQPNPNETKAAAAIA